MASTGVNVQKNAQLTDGERLVRWLTFQEVDRPPFWQVMLGWDSTHDRWWKEAGLFRAWDIPAYFNMDFGLIKVPVPLGMYPTFEEEVLEDHGEFFIVRNEQGIVMRQSRTRSTIPGWLEHPVKGWDDWEKMKKERFNPDDPTRYHTDWDAVNGYLKATGGAANIGWGYNGVFGTPRDLMGAEEVLVAFVEQPDLIHDMMDYLTDHWIRIYDRVSEHVKLSCIHMWEDMSGKQGPLISPKMMRDFMMPNYRKIKDFADSKDIPLFSVDTDGNVDQLLPPMTEAGINVMYPFEVQAGCDVEVYRKEYPKLGMLGGLDKRAMAVDKAAIDKELEKAERLLPLGGYVPGPDHLVPPDVSWENYKYYMERLRALVGKS